MLESQIEREYTRWVKTEGGLCLKQNANWYCNIPDRLVLLPPGIGFFLELKRPGQGLRAGQDKRRASILRKGIPSYFADDLEYAKWLYHQYRQLVVKL